MLACAAPVVLACEACSTPLDIFKLSYIHGEAWISLGIELHLPNSSPGEELVDVISQNETVSGVDYCPVQDAVISKQLDFRLDVLNI